MRPLRYILTTLLFLITFITYYHYRQTPTYDPLSTQDTNTNPSIPTFSTPEHTKFCSTRFSNDYLSLYRNTTTTYCTPDSLSQVLCAHSNTFESRVDSFCLASHVTYDHINKRFVLTCNERKDLWNKWRGLAAGLPSLHSLHTYWYDTGPGYIFGSRIRYSPSHRGYRKNGDDEGDATSNLLLLVKRETGDHMWHGLMELFAAMWTLDTLSLLKHPITKKKVWESERDLKRLRVVILDELQEGPLWDAWKRVGSLEMVRVGDAEPDWLSPSTIISPLAGASNPIWQGDWDDLGCEGSELLENGIARVLGMYGLSEHMGEDRSARFRDLPGAEKEGALRITLISREGTRKLSEKGQVLAAVQAQYPESKVREVLFEGMTLEEQVTIALDTDVMVGVHGAGLTNSIFMGQGGGVVEVQPAELNHRGFLNTARLLKQYYGVMHSEGGGLRDDWHGEDVDVDIGLLLETIDGVVRKVVGLRDGEGPVGVGEGVLGAPEDMSGDGEGLLNAGE